MEILVSLHTENKETTISKIFIDNEFECYGLEDEGREVKVRGETRVPEGTYPVKLRAEGGHHNRYLNKYGADFHRGMLCISNASNWKLEAKGMSFQYILIHIGNTDDDTDGCLLTGEKVINDDMIGRSAAAYMKLYEKVSKALVSGENVNITFDRTK